MAEHNDLGKKGEEIAQIYLENQGYNIIYKNWRFGSDEVDIIAQKNKDFVIIVEVKTRTTSFYGEPQEFVNKQKQKYLIRAAEAFVNQKKIESEIRFDVVSVLLNKDTYKINHIEDAFSPSI